MPRYEFFSWSWTSCICTIVRNPTPRVVMLSIIFFLRELFAFGWFRKKRKKQRFARRFSVNSDLARVKTATPSRVRASPGAIALVTRRYRYNSVIVLSSSAQYRKRFTPLRTRPFRGVRTCSHVKPPPTGIIALRSRVILRSPKDGYARLWGKRKKEIIKRNENNRKPPLCAIRFVHYFFFS